MAFAIVCILMLAGLGVVAALSSLLSKGDDEVVVTGGHDCSGCTSATDGSCQLHCLMEQKNRDQRNKTAKESVI